MGRRRSLREGSNQVLNKSLGKKSKNVFRFFEFRLGINFFHFRLGRFAEVEERLGSPEAGVEIGTG